LSHSAGDRVEPLLAVLQERMAVKAGVVSFEGKQVFILSEDHW
jgi:hypothetical protein